MKPSIKRRQLAQTLARLARIPGAIAQDRVDTVVHDILKKLKTGRPVELPGLGKLVVIPTTKRTQRVKEPGQDRVRQDRRSQNTKRTQLRQVDLINLAPEAARND